MNYLIPVNLTLTAAMFGILWLVQLVHYPMFEGIERSSFLRWHEYHSNRITWIVAPLMVLEFIFSVWLALTIQSGSGWILLALTAVIWLATFFISVPLHNRLQLAAQTSDGQLRPIIKRLVVTNWIRTTAYTVKLLLILGLFLN